MKNLNRKLSVIALSGMAVFGGVAVSGVQAFAAQPEVKVEQQVKDEAAEKVQNLIKEAGYGGVYEAVKSSKDRKPLLDEAQRIAAGSRFFNRGSRSINKKKPVKSLEQILRARQVAMVLRLNNDYVLVVDVAH